MITKVRSIKHILKMKQPALANYVEHVARQVGLDVLHFKDEAVVVNPKDPVWLVSHLDIFGDKPPRRIVQHGKILTADKGVLGGDDRAGVYIMLELMAQGLPYGFLFCYDEEKGCKGSKKLAKNRPELFDGCRLLVGLDRRGTDEVVEYETECHELVGIFTTRGFRHNYGSWTDVAHLSEQLLIPAVNLSVGFEMEHSSSELLDMGHVERMIELLADEPLRKELWALASTNPRPQFRSYHSVWLNGECKGSIDVEGICCICGAELTSGWDPVIVFGGQVYCYDCFKLTWEVDDAAL